MKITSKPVSKEKNYIKCNSCNDIVISLHRHDFRFCKCGAVAIDGGDSYTKISGISGGFTMGYGVFHINYNIDKFTLKEILREVSDEQNS